MPDVPNLPKAPERLIWVALLYVLAAPVFAVQGLARLVVRQKRNRLIDAGFLTCRYCGHGNRLDVQVKCPRCAFTEPRSLLLPCSQCGYVPGWITCAKCAASLRLP